MKKALVTGGCGFIGSNLVKNLIDRDWSVHIVDDLSGGDIQNLKNLGIKFRVTVPALVRKFMSSVELKSNEALVITGDFVDQNVIDYLISAKYDCIFHLAADPRVEHSVKFPIQTSLNNTQKSIELLAVCKSAGIKKFIFASSSAIYGETKILPTPESFSGSPNSPYGLQKLTVEMYMSLFDKLYEFDSVALRFSNVYGPNSDGASPYSTAIGSWCSKLKLKEPLRSDGDGEQSRDLIFVEDVTDAIIFCAEKDDLTGFNCFNVGTGTSITNNQILNEIHQIMGEFKIESAPERLGDVKHTLLDIEKLTNLGWAPKNTFALGLKKTIDWWGLT